MSAHRLDFGDLDLVNADKHTPWWFETLADGFSLGSPEAVQVIEGSLMRDGSPLRVDRQENRQITFRVVICGPDLGALAQGERALAMQCAQARSLLSWTPPDQFGQTTDYVVEVATMALAFDDLREMPSGKKERAYDLTLTCLPFGRSPVPVTQTLIPTATAPTVVDACSATTNWTFSTTIGTATMTATTVTGESVLQFQDGVGGYNPNWTVYFNGTKPVTPFVGIDVAQTSPFGAPNPLGITLNGVAPVAQESVTLGSTQFVRYQFANPGGASPYAFNIFDGGNGTYNGFYIANLLSATAIGASAVMRVETFGSVRAEGSVSLTRAGTAITWAFVYADPQLGAYSPKLPVSWAAGRDGTYVLYSTGLTLGQVVQYRFTDSAGRQAFTAPTRIDAAVAAMVWQPVGQVELGGFDTGLIGAQTVERSVNGGTYAAAVTNTVRLFRLAQDTTLHYTQAISTTTLTIQAPSVDFPYGGVFADGVAVSPTSPGFPSIVVPSTSLMVEANSSDTLPVTSTLTYYPMSHTYNGYSPS